MEEEKQELHHEAVPGYFKIFSIVFAVSLIYLLIIFLTSPVHPVAH